MKAIKNKIHSEQGASITFALLLFLVCAVISSIVIVAATTTSGRLADMARMDQRYYSVTSAARLLCEMDGKNTVVETTNKTTITGEYGITGEPLENQEPGFPKTEAYTEPKPASIVGSDIFEYAGICLLTKPAPDDGIYFNKELELKEEDSSDEKLNISMKAVLNDNGKLIIELHNQNTDKGVYSLRLVFSSAKSNKETSSKTEGDLHTTIERTKISWLLESIETEDSSKNARTS